LSIEGVSVNLPSKGTGLQSLVERILRAVGEDPKREGLLKTPERVEKSLKFLTSGYDIDVDKLVNDALYSENYNEMVIVKDIDIYSLCEHHMLPFFGKCHVAYLPQGKIIGLSKVPRLIDAYSRRLQVQERLTTEIAQCIQNIVKPAGVAVVIDACTFACLCAELKSKTPTLPRAPCLGVLRMMHEPVVNFSVF